MRSCEEETDSTSATLPRSLLHTFAVLELDTPCPLLQQSLVCRSIRNVPGKPTKNLFVGEIGCEDAWTRITLLDDGISG